MYLTRRKVLLIIDFAVAPCWSEVYANTYVLPTHFKHLLLILIETYLQLNEKPAMPAIFHFSSSELNKIVQVLYLKKERRL